MVALTRDVAPKQRLGDEFELPLRADEPVFVGSAVLVVNATQLAERATTRVGAVCRGVAMLSAAANDKTVRIARGEFPRRNSGADPIAATTALGTTVYIEDDQTVALTDGTGTRTAAGTFQGFDENGEPIVKMGVF